MQTMRVSRIQRREKNVKMSKREAGIVAVAIIAMFGASFAFAGNEGVPFD